MQVVDLTQFISDSMPVYPGTEAPTITEATSIARDGFAEKLIRMYSHTGTHIDAPGHILPGAVTLDRLPVEHFIGSACVVDVAAKEGELIEISSLEPHAGRLERSDFVLLRSGWSRRWGKPGYFEGFPLLSEAAAAWLCSFRLKGIGIDMISVDAVDTTDFSIHKIFFRRGLVIVENLTGLEQMEGTGYTFSCMPLKLSDADGSPVRAFAFRI